MEAQRPSPLTTFTSRSSKRRGFPSSKTTSTGTPAASTRATARRNAVASEAVMPCSSISRASTYSTAHARAVFLTCTATRSRSAGLSRFESSRPAIRGSSGRTTAPTASGPAKGPRPTSSSPTTTPPPRAAASSRSKA